MHRWLPGLVALVVLLTACEADPQPFVAPSPVVPSVRPSTAADVAGGGTLRWAIARPSAIVPPEAVDDAAVLVVDTLFDSLTRVDVDGTVRPSAAVRWSTADRGRHWNFTLRRGARYHDGTPVRAADFAASWAHTVGLGLTGSHLQDVEGYRAVREGRASRLAGVTAVDGRTLEVRMSRPTMDLPAIVAHPTLAPLPRAARASRDFAEQPIGNGPYRMVEPWGSGGFVRVQRDPAWQNGPTEQSRARVREVVFRVIDPDAAYVGFQQGRIDVAPVPAGALARAQQAYGSADGGRGPGVVDTPVPALYFLAFNVDQPPWDDPDVRRAFSRAINRRALVSGRRDLALDAARWIVPPALAQQDRTPCETCLHLPSLAAEAFAGAGVTEVTLSIDAEGGHESVATRIRNDLADVGVTVQVTTMPFEPYLQAVESGELGLYRFGWQAEYVSAGAILEATIRSGAPTERGDGANYGGYADRRVDELLDRARRAADEERRRELWMRAERRALRQQAIVPLFSFRQRLVISERVHGLVVTPWGTATPERSRLVADPAIAD